MRHIWAPQQAMDSHLAAQQDTAQGEIALLRLSESWWFVSLMRADSSVYVCFSIFF